MTEYKWPLMKNTITLGDRYELAKFVLTSDKFTQGKKVEQFERAWSDWLGAKHSLFVTSGSTANFLLVASVMEKYGLKKGDKVLVPACTWVTNINPIFQLGLKPVFCDVNLVNYTFSLDHMRKLAEKHDIKMIFVTHLLGHSAYTKVYNEIFPNAIIIDDVCESHGCEYVPGKKVGSDSVGATFSFYFGHHMSTVEGGMISTNNTALYDLMKMKRSHGMSRVSGSAEIYSACYPEIDPSFLFVTDGYNFRNTELGAVLGLSQLKRLDSFIETRRRNHTMFVNIMRKHTDKFHEVYDNEGNSSFCFPFIAKKIEYRQKLLDKFTEYGVEYRPIVGGNLLKQPYLRNYKARVPNADILHSNGIYIGNNQFVNEKDMYWLENILGEI